MSKIKHITFISLLLLVCWSCDGENSTPEPNDSTDKLLITSNVVTSFYSGNGAQWGGYDILNTWTGSPTLSEADWEKLFERVRFMSPDLVRIMVSPGWNYMVDGQFSPEKSNDVLVKILDFCESEGISVVFGEWGHQGGNSIDEGWLDNSVHFLKWLLETKGYSCIKYMTLVNEPNGDWSSMDGNYDLWQSLVSQYHSRLVHEGMSDKIKIIGPDIAIWDTNTLWWLNNTVTNLGNQVRAYDIHTYPTEEQVRDGDYQNMIAAYSNAIPDGMEMIMGEVGFKYKASSELGAENKQRINDDPYASDDSNMFIYHSFYGIDIADAVIQNMLAGYSGVVVWNMDDAMYNIDGGSSTRLKRWGFWNILGEEKFEDPGDEAIRPWFYPMSLLSKYVPRGSEVLEIELPDKKGLRAVAVRKGDKYTIAIVNSHFVEYEVQLAAASDLELSDINGYKFIAKEGDQFDGPVNSDGFAVPYESNISFSLEMNGGHGLTIAPRSFYLFTNMTR